MNRSRPMLRAIGAPGVCLAALVLVVPPSSAAVTFFGAGGFQVTATSDGAGDAITLACTAGEVRYVEGAVNALPCADTSMIVVNGNGGIDAIDLSGLQPADFPVLNVVNIDGGVGADNIKGSFAGDSIEGDEDDTIQGLGGRDRISGGDSVFGGDGNDTLTTPFGPADAGPGDDVIDSPSAGPVAGGPGFDTLSFDFSDTNATGATVNFVVTDPTLHIDVQPGTTTVDVPITSVELYELVLFDNGVQTWNSAAYSGSVDLKALGGVDAIVTGPGEDFVDAGDGNDTITAGAGFDYVKAGPGDDTVSARDGAVDRVICGDGNDTVVADYGDVLTACETVRLPPPATGAIKGPRTVKKGVKATFSFSSKTPGAKFQCKLDTRAWKSCRSPFGVATGTFKLGSRHVLKVRAVLAGVKDATPSKKTFTIVR